MSRVKQVLVTQVDGSQVKEVAHDAKSGVKLMQGRGRKCFVTQGAQVLIEFEYHPGGFLHPITLEGKSR